MHAAHPPSPFRPMLETDLEAVIDIEERCYEFPWTYGVHRDCLRVGYSCWVIDYGQSLAGYGVMSLGAGEAHVLNLCVDVPLRRRGLARRLLLHLMQVAEERHAEVILLEVRPSNSGAIRLYEDLGFSEVGFRRNYYPARHGREDAIILACDLLPRAQPSGDIEVSVETNSESGSPDNPPA